MYDLVSVSGHGRGWEEASCPPARHADAELANPLLCSPLIHYLHSVRAPDGVISGRKDGRTVRLLLMFYIDKLLGDGAQLNSETKPFSLASFPWRAAKYTSCRVGPMLTERTYLRQRRSVLSPNTGRAESVGNRRPRGSAQERR